MNKIPTDSDAKIADSKSKKRRSTKSPEPPNKKSGVSSKSGSSPKRKPSWSDTSKDVTELLMYGKKCNIQQPHDDIMSCFECKGAMDHKLPKDHPVLLCDGEG